MASSQTAIAAPTALAQPPFSGLGRRLAAYFVDLAISASVFLFFGLTMRGLHGVRLWRPAVVADDPMAAWHAMGTGARLAMVFGFYVLSMGGVIYFALFESSGWQATFGKRLLNIHVTDHDGTRIGVLRALGRSFSKFFPGYLGGNFASLVTIPCTKDKKALHDYVAKTLVVRGRPVSGGSIESWRVVAAFGIPFVWLMATCLATF